ncbi:MAG TPA: bifunctional glutamine synthetase adenylyltransferase/deadenyltransferase, partial [Spongiibacteraceae bacterium]|nr:bifunctional glutamine synthetase adenylyltransferase/deadenyltransferase [Spongiibacteraceae bacterium]
LAWQQLIAKHGTPRDADGSPCGKNFIVVAYGKFGGIELSHSSDLDLVFIHGTDPNQTTDGAAAIDNGTFFTRLGQRMIHILTAQTMLGPLYEVDMRLRPSGNSGLLVSTLNAFADYQRQRAWTWEHQALVRARAVAGDDHLAEAFEQVRREILCLPRDQQKLRDEVIGMRQKMREQLKPRNTETPQNPVFDLKHGSGAIVDIEFIVQYAVLAWAHSHPALTRWTDNIRILETLEQEGLSDTHTVEAMIDAYKSYRSTVHRRSLQQISSIAGLADFSTQRQIVLNTWRALLGEELSRIQTAN